MNSRHTDEKRHDHRARCSRYVARGALLWGAPYTAGASGMAYLLVPIISGDTPSFSEVVSMSLPICPAIAALRGYIEWRLVRANPAAEKGRIELKKRRNHNSILTLRRDKNAA